MTGDLLLAGTALRTTPESIQFSLRSLQGTVAGTSDRIPRLETTVASLVELIGAFVIPAWNTKTEVEQGSDEEALRGAPEMRSANNRGLTINFEFERQRLGFAYEDIITISPPPGTALKPGSTVVITINLEGKEF